jgi:type II secretory pathway pseudopilin PulG
MNNKKQQKNNGFTLLFAVLVSTLILAVGASIISIALKQLTLSGSARDSHFAFYAANSGVECAFYWDSIGIEGQPPVFATSSESLLATGDIECSNQTVTIDNDGTDFSDPNPNNHDYWGSPESPQTDAATTTFRINLEDVPYCVDVEVSKWADGDGIKSSINARGYNTCDEENKRRVERGLRITY